MDQEVLITILHSQKVKVTMKKCKADVLLQVSVKTNTTASTLGGSLMLDRFGYFRLMLKPKD